MKYDVALSFAGEDREYVATVASELKKRKINVFYDEYEVATLWGQDLYQHLSMVYSELARFTIIFISDNYAKKLWTKHELRNAQARAFKEAKEYILPARFDDTSVPGLLDTIGYIDLRKTTAAQLSKIIIDKLEQEKPTFQFDHKAISRNDLKEQRQYLLTIDLNTTDSESGVVFNLDNYSTFNEILNDLFIYYLKDKVQPYSYGFEWILLTEPFHQRVIAPLDWVLNRDKPIYDIDPNWTKNIELKNAGISKGSYLEVNYMRYPLEKKVYGVLTNDEKLVDTLNLNAKAISLLRDKFIPCHAISSELKDSYKYHLVYSDWLSVTKSPFLIDDGKLIDENLLKMLQR